MNMDKVRNHFEDEAGDFDRIILTLIPHYATMLRTLVAAIPFEKSLPLRVIDLGCGTGTVAATVLKVFPNAQVTCLDAADNMIAMAREKLAHYPQTNYIVADFYTYKFDAGYDIAVSSLALHHLKTDKDKQSFYRRIYEGLEPGGVFYNADVVTASNEFLQTVYVEEWRRFMAQNISKDEIEGKWMPKSREEDHPAKLTDHLKWMSEIGFLELDVLWKCFGFAVYGGIRP